MALSSITLIRRSLVFFRRTHVGVVLGAALSTAIIVGALLVGDSVRYSLKRLALARLGNATHALSAGDRFTRAEVAGDLRDALAGNAAAVLLLEGTATRPDGAARANRVQVAGVDKRFWTIGGNTEMPELVENEAVVNAKLAARLQLEPGASFVVKLGNAGEVPGDSPLAREAKPRPLRLTVKAVHGDEQFGRFSLRVNQVQPYGVFVARRTLESHAELGTAANVLLVEAADGEETAAIQQAFGKAWNLHDAALALQARDETGGSELRSRRVFLDPPVVEAARKACPRAQIITTYFVNAIRAGNRSTPYSFVTAPGAPAVQDSMPDDAMIVNEWLANDLALTSGARVVLDYFVPGETGTLRETNRAFRVVGIVPASGPYGDQGLMPDFPGLAEAETCNEWDPGMAIDLDRIREKDEAYWRDHKGTPKAFVTQAAAESMWSNRFGHVTAMRFPPQAGDTNVLAESIMAHLEPASLGLVFRPVREEALVASRNAVDFGGLFIGLSFFIVVAALLLTALLFAFSIQQRTREAALLLALGYRLGHVRLMLLAEGACLAVLGAVLGCPLGLLYNESVVRALNGVWQGAVETSSLVSHVQPVTVLIGAVSGAAAALLALLGATHRLAKRPLSELQQAGSTVSGLFVYGRPWRSRIVAGLCLAGVVVILVSTAPGRGREAAGAFFAAGTLMITAGLAIVNLLVRRMSGGRNARRFNVAAMGLWNNGRRRWRSLSISGVIACGVFIVVAVGASRYGAVQDASRKDSGTGGYALYGETTTPLAHDLNRQADRKTYRLAGKLPESVRFVQLRVRDGDDASCLNLNRVTNPRILGVRAGAFADDERFTFAEVIQDAREGSPWRRLDGTDADGAVPAIADQAVIVWGLGKKVGDVLEYVDERGQPLKLRLVAGLVNSVFQGSVLISDEAFRRHFPSASGTQVMLVETPEETTPAVAAELERALQDWGLELTISADRLAEFAEVENTYLGIFLALGGLGLIVGCVGLGIAVMRSAMERRGELAILRAVGYTRGALFGLMLSEHAMLLVMGVCCGGISAWIAVLPSLASPGAQVPYVTIALLVAGILLSGIVWIAVGCHAATRGTVLPALRHE